MPSYVYFILSVIGLAFSVIQNIGNTNKYTLGLFTCKVPSCLDIFIIKIVYILFWTWVLNLICKNGHTGIAWFLLFLPFITLFLLMGGVIIHQKKNAKKTK
jgi:hypothetical protein